MENQPIAVDQNNNSPVLEIDQNYPGIPENSENLEEQAVSEVEPVEQQVQQPVEENSQPIEENNELSPVLSNEEQVGESIAEEILVQQDLSPVFESNNEAIVSAAEQSPEYENPNIEQNQEELNGQNIEERSPIEEAEMQAEIEVEEADGLDLQADANVEELPANPEIPEIPNPVFEENIIEQAESPILSQEEDEDQNKIVSSFLQAEEQVNNLPNEQLQQPEIHLNLVQDPEIKAEIESNQVLVESQNEIEGQNLVPVQEQVVDQPIQEANEEIASQQLQGYPQQQELPNSFVSPVEENLDQDLQEEPVQEIIDEPQIPSMEEAQDLHDQQAHMLNYPVQNPVAAVNSVIQQPVDSNVAIQQPMGQLNGIQPQGYIQQQQPPVQYNSQQIQQQPVAAQPLNQNVYQPIQQQPIQPIQAQNSFQEPAAHQNMAFQTADQHPDFGEQDDARLAYEKEMAAMRADAEVANQEPEVQAQFEPSASDLGPAVIQEQPVESQNQNQNSNLNDIYSKIKDMSDPIAIKNLIASMAGGQAAPQQQNVIPDNSAILHQSIPGNLDNLPPINSNSAVMNMPDQHQETIENLPASDQFNDQINPKFDHVNPYLSQNQEQYQNQNNQYQNQDTLNQFGEQNSQLSFENIEQAANIGQALNNSIEKQEESEQEREPIVNFQNIENRDPSMVGDFNVGNENGQNIEMWDGDNSSQIHEFGQDQREEINNVDEMAWDDRESGSPREEAFNEHRQNSAYDDTHYNDNHNQDSNDYNQIQNNELSWEDVQKLDSNNENNNDERDNYDDYNSENRNNDYGDNNDNEYDRNENDDEDDYDNNQQIEMPLGNNEYGNDQSEDKDDREMFRDSFDEHNDDENENEDNINDDRAEFLDNQSAINPKFRSGIENAPLQISDKIESNLEDFVEYQSHTHRNLFIVTFFFMLGFGWVCRKAIFGMLRAKRSRSGRRIARTDGGYESGVDSTHSGVEDRGCVQGFLKHGNYTMIGTDDQNDKNGGENMDDELSLGSGWSDKGDGDSQDWEKW